MPKPQTSEERHRAFNALFETVKADGEGTAMGSTDKARDEAIGKLTFDKLAEKPQDYELPDVAPKEEEEEKPPATHPAEPLKIDEKTKKFYQIFDHVTDVQATEYGGQAKAPSKDLDFGEMPEPPPEPVLPEPARPERDFLKEDTEERMRTAAPEPKHSERYDKAHKAFVKTFGDTMQD